MENERQNESGKSTNKERPLIGITAGDVNGIGVEVTIKALMDPRMTKYFTPVLICSGKIIGYYRKNLGLQNFNYHQIDSLKKVNPRKINVLNFDRTDFEVCPGQPSKECGEYARKSLYHGVELLKEGKINALVTAPLSKELIQNEEFDFPGHTEFLAKSFEKEEVLMLMVHDDLRVGVVTGHIPLSKVSESITQELIEKKASILIKCLKDDFGIKKPKLAVLGLNPHAGENGLLGPEENEKIIPAIESLKNKGHIVIGPLSADGFFGSSQFLQFDGILAMYHDQGLIPFKQFAFGDGVNFTAGLPKIRTSPDHGTAFNLAGKNLADPSSMKKALFCAYDILKQKAEV